MSSNFRVGHETCRDYSRCSARLLCYNKGLWRTKKSHAICLPYLMHGHVLRARGCYTDNLANACANGWPFSDEANKEYAFMERNHVHKIMVEAIARVRPFGDE